MPHGNICHHNKSNVVYQIMTTVTHIYDNPQMLTFLDILIFYILYHESQYKVTKGQNVCEWMLYLPLPFSLLFFFPPLFFCLWFYSYNDSSSLTKRKNMNLWAYKIISFSAIRSMAPQVNQQEKSMNKIFGPCYYVTGFTSPRNK